MLSRFQLRLCRSLLLSSLESKARLEIKKASVTLLLDLLACRPERVAEELHLPPSDSTGRPLQKDTRREWTLFDPKTGVPRGRGLGRNYFLQERLVEWFHFPKKGTYALHLGQNMCKDSLLGVSSAGTGSAEASPPLH